MAVLSLICLLSLFRPRPCDVRNLTVLIKLLRSALIDTNVHPPLPIPKQKDDLFSLFFSKTQRGLFSFSFSGNGSRAAGIAMEL